MMKKKLVTLALVGFATAFTAVAPAFAMALSCPGNGVPVVDSVSRTYNAHTGQTATVIVYHCV
jgi:hypothetical protein